MGNALYRRLIELTKQDDPTTESDFADLIRDGLTASHTRSIFLAAELANKANSIDYVSELLDAYARLLVDPVKSDPGCEAKTVIVAALEKSGFDDEHFFLEAIKYRQLEPSYRGATDTAAK